MGIGDLIIAAGLIGGSLYILYRSLWKKKGQCHGCSCSGGGCSQVPTKHG